MGRKKSYSRENLLQKATELFRDHGFAGTSAEMLVEGLDVNRYSIYAEFGSKQGLFDAALMHYDKQVLDCNFGPLEGPGAGVGEIKALLEVFGSAEKSPDLGRGCLFCNTAVEFGSNDPSGAGLVQRYFKRISGAFCTALDNAHAKGELRTGTDTREEAAFFTASVIGLSVMLRASAPASLIEGAARVAIEHLNSLCAEAPRE